MFPNSSLAQDLYVLTPFLDVIAVQAKPRF